MPDAPLVPGTPAAPKVRVVVTPAGWLLLAASLVTAGLGYFLLLGLLPIWFGPLTKRNPAGMIAGVPFFLVPVLWHTACRVAGRCGVRAMFVEPL